MQFFKTLALAVATTALVAACGGSDTEDRLDVRDPVVRFLHAVPGGANLSFFRQDEVQGDATDVAYKSVSRYYDVSNNSATWSVRAAAAPTVPLASVDVNPEQGNRYTFVAVQGSGPGAVDLVAIDDPYDKGLTSDRGRVRVLHAAPATAAVDVYLMQPAQDLAVTAPSYSNVAYKATQPASGDDSTEVPGGSYRLVLTAAGTKTVLFDAPVVSIANNADWLLLAIPGPTGAADDVRVLVAQGNDDENGTTLELVSQ
jgi:hypothetical protein